MTDDGRCTSRSGSGKLSVQPSGGRPRRPRHRPAALGPVALVALACLVVLGGCLPTSVRPTPAPVPTPVPTPTPAPTPSPTPGPPTPTPAPSFLVYTVVRGDTLVGIARRHQTSGRSIAYWNRARYPSLDPESAAYRPDLLQAGWVLQILPGQEYVPPIDDGESGEEVTPAPSADEEYETDSPAPG